MVYVLSIGPAILGLVCIVMAIQLLKRPVDAKANTPARVALGMLSLLVALGVGACYAAVFAGGLS